MLSITGRASLLLVLLMAVFASASYGQVSPPSESAAGQSEVTTEAEGPLVTGGSAGASTASGEATASGSTVASETATPADGGSSSGSETAAVPAADRVYVAILPFRVHSARSLGYLTESLGELMAKRLVARSSQLSVIAPNVILAATGPVRGELDDNELRTIAERLGARAAVTASLTELAGRFSLDVRIVPASSDVRSQTIVITAESEEGLLGQLDDLVDRVASAVLGSGPGEVESIEIVGAGELRDTLKPMLKSVPGQPYDSDLARADRDMLERQAGVAGVRLDTRRDDSGVHLTFQVTRAAQIFARSGPGEDGDRVEEIRITGNRRIEAAAIRARIRTKVGNRLARKQLAQDVRDVYGLGFFREVNVTTTKGEGGVILTFAVEENPVVRQISISGNGNIEGDKIREGLTLTTGSTLDYPLLYENTQRIEALYRAEGYYLASVSYTINPISDGSVAIDFEVKENEKLRLKTIAFEGNESFDDKELSGDFATKRWRFWSPATSWYDKTGTYSEPVFMQDLRSVEKKYTDSGFLQVEVGEPVVDPSQEGLTVSVPIREGPRFIVGKISVEGDETVDLPALEEMLMLEPGDVFNRSHLTEDVEILERHYTDRGFYFASVQPRTEIIRGENAVDIQFRVEKGPLYFIRKINIAGNTQTVGDVVRREMRVVEGELYSARALQLSNMRVRNLGFFEDVSFEPKATQDPSQLDLEMTVVERPTGSLSFGAGYSSQDSIVVTAAVAQSNLFGRGYAVSLSADFGKRTDRFYFSFSDPYLFGSQVSFGSTIFLTRLQYANFEQSQFGFDLSLGHSLSEDNRTRGFLRYSLADRKVDKDNRSNGAATILREVQRGSETTSLIGLSLRSDTRDDRFAPTSGFTWGATLEYAGVGGFTKFLRAEIRGAAYLGAPSWLLKRSTFVVATRMGYTLPFNSVSEFGRATESSACLIFGCGENIRPLDSIDRNLKLPLTERYFLGGLGSYGLRGYESRSVGPRRSILTRMVGDPSMPDQEYYPIGRTLAQDSSGQWVAVCERNGQVKPNACNKLSDKKDSDFADLRKTDVVGGSSFISSSFEYRFPISDSVGLQGVAFVDMGNAFAEGGNLFDVTEWRYGTGAGLLWFSPFGPLQVVLGFPLNRLSIEKSMVFEFSVGGAGL